ncbi:MAG TPA: alpha-amylase/4-alpha-glucanotransferase domain-containing protein [Fibrobacteraceae bacterium]|nr:alpha-amylase/4-alpha-glucanotransferase domain-containing protein [Fibrobacteraceae bacterium]
MQKIKIVPLLCIPDHPESKDQLSAAARELLFELKEFLAEPQSRITLSCPGPFLEAAQKHCPKEFAWLRERIRDGWVEMLGGSYHEALLPLFPQTLRRLQLRRHREFLRSGLACHPRGWYCPNQAWEISLVGDLCAQEYEFTLLSDQAFAEALSQPLPISGWRILEDCGQVIRIFPLASQLSSLWMTQDADGLAEALAALPENDPGWFLEAQAYPLDWRTSGEALHSLHQALERLGQMDRQPQLWTPSQVLDQTRSAGTISLISTLGPRSGMPVAVHTCRELLNRRPESNFIHKKLLYIHHRARQGLNPTEIQAVDALLMPLMSARYYRNLPGGVGIRGLTNRAEAHAQLLAAERALDKLSNRNLRLEVLDFLGDGSRQILSSTPSMGFVLDYLNGGVLRSLDFKPLGINLVNGQLEDGAPSVALRDHLLPMDHRTAMEISGDIDDRSGQLDDPFDYQIKRQSDRIQLVLTGEQGLSVQNRPHSLRVIKVIGFKLEEAELQVSWQLTNATFQAARCQFATECVVTFPNNNRRRQSLSLNGKRLPWSDSPCICSEIRELVFDDRSINGRVQIESTKPVTLFFAPVLGSAHSAAPEEFQGHRMVFLWDLELKGQESTANHLRIRMDKRFRIL